MSPARPLVCALLAATLLSGCGSDDLDDAQPPQQTPTTETAAPATEPTAETQTCTNDDSGYTLEYPADWHTNDGDIGEPCTWFEPEPFEVPEATEFFPAVTVRREPVAAEEIVEGDDPSREVLSREEAEVAGQRAFRIEAESTGQGLLDAGVRYYQIVVVLDGESLLLVTYDFEDQDYERNREVVDQMAESLELTG